MSLIKSIMAVGFMCFLSGYAGASTLDEINKATYKLEISQEITLGETTRGFCSGTPISREFLLTAAHCVDFSPFTKEPVIKFTSVKRDPDTLDLYEERIVYLKYVASIKDKDVMILKPVDPNYIFYNHVDVREGIYEAPFGTLVRAFGHPYGLETFMAHGEFMGPGEQHGLKGLRKKFNRTSVPISPGMSGGGLYVEVEPGNWELIGVATASSPRNPHLSYFSTLEYIHELLEKVLKK